MSWTNMEFHSIAKVIRQPVVCYVERKAPVGDFLAAVIANDLKGAFGRASHISRAALFDIVSWFYNYAPRDCWGSPAKMAAWLEAGREERSK